MQELEKPSFARFGNQPSFLTSDRPDEVVSRAEASSRPKAMRGSSAPEVRTSRAFDFIITAVLVLVFFGIPVFFTGLTFQGIAFEKQIFFYFCLLIGLVAWVSKGVMTGEMRIRRTPLDIPIVLFWLFSIVATVFSVDRWHSFWGFFGDPSRGFISLTALVLAYFFIMSHFTERRRNLMLLSFLASGVFVIVWSFLVIMKIHFIPASLEAIAPLSLIGSMSTLTLFLSLLIPLMVTALFLLFRDGAGVSRRIRIAGAVVLGGALLLDLFILIALYPFVTWAVVLGGLGFFLVYILAQIVRPVQELTWMPMVIFVIVLAFLMIGRNELAQATLPVEVTPNMKLSWQVAKESLSANFLSGSGLATYGYNFSLFRPQEFNGNALYTLRFYQGTGLVAEAISTIGVVGTILMLVVWFSFLSIGLYLLTMDKAKNKIASLGLWSVAVMLFIASFVAPINATILILGVILSALALATLLQESGSEERYWELSFRATPKFALALAFVFMVVSAGVAFIFVFMGKVFIADISAGMATREPASIDGTIPKYVKAIQMYPQEGRYLTRVAQEYMAIANAEGGKGANDRDVNQIAFTVREGVAAGLRAKDLMPNDVLATEALGLVYENASIFATDALPKAEEMYARALELEPQNPLFAIKLGQIKRLAADGKQDGAEKSALLNEAKMYFSQAVEKKPDLAIAHYNLAVISSRMKDYDAAIQSTSQAIRLAPTNLSFRYNLGLLYQERNTGNDRAEAEKLYKQVLDANDRLIDVRLSLGLLYEAQNKRDAAMAEYEKILALIPSDDTASANVKQTRTQISQVIENLRSGKGNIPAGNSLAEPGPITPATAAPTNPAASQSESLLNGPTP
jgi:tetratricopeptide (TPR) repeat protein